MNITCNNCLDEFEINPEEILMKKTQDIAIQYFLCPSCGTHYVILAEDEEMQHLVEKAVRLHKQIITARKHGFREKKIRELIQELKDVRARQKEIEPELKKKAEQILKSDKEEP